MKIKITIDSNLINLRKKLPDMNKIEELFLKNKIEIVGAQRLYDEMLKYNIDAFDKATNYKNISEPFTIGYSAIGSAYIAGKYEIPSFKTFAKIMFPDIDIDSLSENQSNDIMHLIAHAHSNSDYFVTDNTKDFIDAKRSNSNRGQELKNLKRNQLHEIGISVLTPLEFLKHYNRN